MDLAFKGFFWCKERVFDKLLGNGAASFRTETAFDIGNHGSANCLYVYSIVTEETVVLYRYDGIRYILGQVI